MRVHVRIVAVLLLLSVAMMACGGCGDTSGVGTGPSTEPSPTPTSPPFGHLTVTPHTPPSQLLPCGTFYIYFTLENTGGQPLDWTLAMSYFSDNAPSEGADPIENHLSALIGTERIQNGSGGTLNPGQSIDVEVTGSFPYPLGFQLEFKENAHGPFSNSIGYTLNYCQ